MNDDSNDFDPIKMIRFRVTLEGVEPPIWREFVVPDDYTLGHLHDVLQMVMGWDDSHPHEFEIRRERFGHVNGEDSWDARDVRDEESVDLQALELRKRMKFAYTYDFGDDWRHELEVMEIREADHGDTPVPFCLGGARACPPEDCGGAWRYPELLEAIGDPGHPEHGELVEWVGEFDPEAYDVTTVNEMLKSYGKEIVDEMDDDGEYADLGDLPESIADMNSEELGNFMRETLRSFVRNAEMDESEVDRIDFHLMIQTAELSHVCRERRESMGVSLADMAKKLGAKKSAIQALEGVGGEDFDFALCTRYVCELGLTDWFSKWKEANPKIAGLFNDPS